MDTPRTPVVLRCAAALLIAPALAHGLPQEEVPPKLVGQTVEQVKIELGPSNFTDLVFVDPSGEEFAPAGDELVVYSATAPGQKVPLDSELVFVAAKEGEPTTVPEVATKTLEQALKMLAANGLAGKVRHYDLETGEFEEPDHKMRAWNWAVMEVGEGHKMNGPAKTGDTVKLLVASTVGNVRFTEDRVVLNVSGDVGVIITEIGYVVALIAGIFLGGLLVALALRLSARGGAGPG